jgi:hypothetical protein
MRALTRSLRNDRGSEAFDQTLVSTPSRTSKHLFALPIRSLRNDRVSAPNGADFAVRETSLSKIRIVTERPGNGLGLQDVYRAGRCEPLGRLANS